METAREKILIMEGDEADRRGLEDLLREAGYEPVTASACSEGLKIAREQGVDIVLLDANFPGIACRDLLAEIKGAVASAGIRVIMLVAGGASERVHMLDLGADDAVSPPWDSSELLARIRVQLRAKKAGDLYRDQAGNAEQDREMTRTAFQALAATEEMTRKASRFGRGLKAGLVAVLAVIAIMAAIFFRFSRRAATETQRSYAVVERLNQGLANQEELVKRARKMSEELQAHSAASAQAQLERQSREIRARMENASSEQIAELRGELAQTQKHLRQVEVESTIAQNIIRKYSGSVCLIHVKIMFRDKATRQPLRYAKVTAGGEPVEDIEGKVMFSLDGNGPVAKADALGTGFLVEKDGRILTNHHVVEPWWNNEEMKALGEHNLEPVIEEMTAFFPGSPLGIALETKSISSGADLAVVQGDVSKLGRPVIPLDDRKTASISGDPVVLMGYATGIDAVLARADEGTVRTIIASSHGDTSAILTELARKNLIRPIVTQGHIGDVLADKIVYDAQTTSGGSGGPLFNPEGKVVGVNYAILRGFGGSNFGIPVRYARQILAH